MLFTPDADLTPGHTITVSWPLHLGHHSEPTLEWISSPSLSHFKQQFHHLNLVLAKLGNLGFIICTVKVLMLRILWRHEANFYLTFQSLFTSFWFRVCSKHLESDLPRQQTWPRDLVNVLKYVWTLFVLQLTLTFQPLVMNSSQHQSWVDMDRSMLGRLIMYQVTALVTFTPKVSLGENSGYLTLARKKKQMFWTWNDKIWLNYHGEQPSNIIQHNF